MRPAGVKAIKIAVGVTEPSRKALLAKEIARDTGFELVEIDKCDVLVSDGTGAGTPAFRGATVLWADSGTRDDEPATRATLPAALDARDVLAAARLVNAGLLVLRDDHDDRVTYPEEHVSNDANDLEALQRLTGRELEILQRLAAGDSNKRIANALGLSLHTVKFHVSSILRKLGASSRLEAVGISLRFGIVMV